MLVPPVFSAYVRILHPLADGPSDPVLTRWSQLAQQAGIALMNRLIQFPTLTHRLGLSAAISTTSTTTATPSNRISGGQQTTHGALLPVKTLIPPTSVGPPGSWRPCSTTSNSRSCQHCQTTSAPSTPKNVTTQTKQQTNRHLRPPLRAGHREPTCSSASCSCGNRQ